MGCISCARNFHVGCKSIDNDGNCCCLSKSEEIEDEDWRKISKSTGRGAGKRDESLRDQQSTGRKRAAIKYPLNRESPCEWQELRFAGGGKTPIVGCQYNLQQARHHGPDKNTLNNDEGNVHRICHACHNRWHSRNDANYKWGGIYTPHDGIIKATPQEVVAFEMSWAGKILKKAVD